MNPQMMQQAQQMMANMSPEQLANVQQMVANMPADQREAMQRQAMAMGMGGGMPMGGAAPPQAPAQPATSAAIDAATKIKNEGNELVSAQRYDEAIGRYKQAKRLLSEETSSEAKALGVTCLNNCAMCHLKLEDWDACVTACDEVLQGGSNLKALWRRGQANMGLLHWKPAIKDLQHALRLCPAGDPHKDSIAQKLAIAKAHQRCGESTDLSDTDSPAAAESPNGAPGTSYNDGSVTIEDVTDDDPLSHIGYPPATSQRRGRAANTAASPLSGGATQGGASNANKVIEAQRAMQMLSENPQEAQKMADHLDSMSDAEFARVAQMQGMAGMDRNTVKQALSMFKNVTPEQARMYADMAKNMNVPGASNASASTSAARSTGAVAGSSGAGSSAAAPAMPGVPPGMDPAAAMAMMQNMTPEQLEQAAAAASSSGMLPAGMSPEMLKMSMNMMKNMKPEDLASMQAAAGAGTAPGAAGGGGGGMPDMSAMLSNPETMKQAVSMMRGMSEDDLAIMMKSTRPGMDDTTARKMAQQMQSIDPDAKWVQLLMGGAALASRGYQGAMSAKQYLLANPKILVALIVLVVALVLRLFGFM